MQVFLSWFPTLVASNQKRSRIYWWCCNQPWMILFSMTFSDWLGTIMTFQNKTLNARSLKPSPVIKVSNKEFCSVIVLVSVPGSNFVRSNLSFLRLSFSFWSSLWLVLTYLLYNTLHIYFHVYFLIYYQKYYVLYQKPPVAQNFYGFSRDNFGINVVENVILVVDSTVSKMGVFFSVLSRFSWH